MGLLSAVLESAAAGEAMVAVEKAAFNQSIALEAKSSIITITSTVRTFNAEIRDFISTFTIITSLNSLALRAAATRSRRNNLQNEIQNLLPAVTILTTCEGDASFISAEFNSTIDDFQHINDLLSCAEKLQSAGRLFECKRYQEASRLYTEMTGILDKTVNNKEFIKLSNQLMNKVRLKRTICVNEITEQWHERLIWSIVEDGNIKNLEIKIDVRDSENFQEIINSLFVLNCINAEIVRFGNFFIESVIPAIVSRDCKISIKNEGNVINIEIENTNDSCDIDSPIIFIDNIILFLETVQSGIDCRWEDNRTVFTILGQMISEKFFEIIIQHIKVSISTDDSVMNNEILYCVEKLKNYLRETCFINEKESPLEMFVSQMNTYVYDKKCEKLLNYCRELIKSNFQCETMDVSCNFQLDINEYSTGNICNRNILSDPYLLGKCKISKNVFDLMKLITTELEEAQHISTREKNKTILTIRNIIEMYYMFVPYYQNDTLNDNPTDIALYYNNCFYLTHSMIGHPWSKMYSKEYAQNINIHLIDQVHNIRISAILKFSQYIKTQQKFIESTIQNSELNNIEALTSLSNNSELAIFECISKLKILKRHWQPLLTTETYKKVMFDLVEFLCKELFNIIITIKDKIIGEEFSYDISVIYQSVLDSMPKLLPENNCLNTISKHYIRLMELTILLKSPLFTSANSWLDKEQHLSKIFTCEEIKHLIRIIYPKNLQKSIVLNMIQ